MTYSYLLLCFFVVIFQLSSGSWGFTDSILFSKNCCRNLLNMCFKRKGGNISQLPVLLITTVNLSLKKEVEV